MTATAIRNKSKILIVEDELLAAENLARNLRKQGYEVTSIVDTGEEAIAKASETHPDLILMDIMLQGDMDGITAAANITDCLRVPIVYMTAYADDATLERAKITNPYGYLIKPFNPQDLKANIEIVLQKFHSETAVIESYLAQLQEAKKQLAQLTEKDKFPLLNDQERLLMDDLSLAIKRQELSLVYQPQLNLQTNQVVGVEALLRWHHPQRGWISPAQFIPLAEATGLIIPIGEWVLRTACQQLRQWQENGRDQLQISVNLSVCQVQKPDFIERLQQILLDTKVNPQTIELELTESLCVQDVESVLQQLEAIKILGIKLAIDDFGTGYSSLSHLHRFPFDTLKLDRAFVREIDTNPQSAAIASAIIAMAHQLNLKVVAEGVETLAELNFLCQHHCDEIQGYIWSPPLPASEF